MAKNVIFVRGNTATINSTAVTDGQLLYDTTTGQHYIDVGSTRKEVGNAVDTALSTTSTNAIANNALTTSIINTTAEVNAITADYVPCGTKPVKELITNLNGVNIIHEGEGSATKYYMQVGADTSSKKQLGKPETGTSSAYCDNTFRNYTFNFSRTYSVAPKVYVNNQTQSPYYTFHVVSSTTTSFTITAWGAGEIPAGTQNFDWVAVPND